jgi:hypothetical protein
MQWPINGFNSALFFKGVSDKNLVEPWRSIQLEIVTKRFDLNGGPLAVLPTTTQLTGRWEMQAKLLLD